MSIGNLESKVSKALNSPDVHFQNRAINSVIGQVGELVQQIREDKNLIRDISNLERQASKLRGKRDDPEAQEELRSIEEMVAKGKEVRSSMDRKRETIRSLKRQVQTLHDELQQI